MIVVITAVNIRGTRKSADLLNVTTAIKVVAILGMGTVLLWHGNTASLRRWAAIRPPASSALGLASGFGLAMISVLWAYEGWQYVTYIAGETLNPQRTFPLAFFIGTGALIAIYLFANLGYLVALGPAAFPFHARCRFGTWGCSWPRCRQISRPPFSSPCSARLMPSCSMPRASITRWPKIASSSNRSRQVHPKFGTPAFAICRRGHLVRGPSRQRHVRTAAHLCCFYRLDFLRPRRSLASLFTASASQTLSALTAFRHIRLLRSFSSPPRPRWS